MTIHFVCPHCRSNENVGDNYGGAMVPCKACGQMVAVPSPMGMAPGKKAGMGVAGILVFVLLGVIVLFVGCGGVLVALLLPAVQSARQAARTMHSTNNMKQIMLAMHNYHDVYQALPPAYITDADGKPMTSWRVLILPYMEQGATYGQYDMTKPWDSPENLAVAERVPAVYQSPLVERTPENRLQTDYLLASGVGTVFADPDKAKFANIPDGTSNTICAIETADSGVIWTQPTDLDAARLDFIIHAMGDAKPGQINAASPRGAVVGMFDGSVRVLPTNVQPAELKKAIEAADGQAVALP